MDKSQLVKVPLKYGIVGGILSMLVFLVLYWSGDYPLVESSYIINGVIILLMLFFAVKELRDYHYDGKLLYWQGMTAGFVCVLVICLLSALFVVIFISYIDEHILIQHQSYIQDKLTDHPEEWIERHGEEIYQQVIAQNRQLLSPLEIAVDDFLKKGVVGLFISTVIALLFKRT